MKLSEIITENVHLTATPEFKKWFAGSKVVDNAGNPLKVYHGTSKDMDFKNFRIPKNGVWFTADPKSASDYASENDSQGFNWDSQKQTYVGKHMSARVIPVYLKILNPFYAKTHDDIMPPEMKYADNYRRAQGISFDRLRQEGYDGIILGDDPETAVYVMLDYNNLGKIKSAISNTNFADNKKNINENEYLTEAFPYSPGSVVPDNIVDYRDPTKSNRRRFKYEEPFYDKKLNKNITHGYIQKPTTYLVMCKNGQVIVFYYGDNNTIPWADLLDILEKNMDRELQTHIFGISVSRSGYLLNRSREYAFSFSGNINKYSSDIKILIKAMADAGVAMPDMRIWIGNTAAGKGEYIGTVKSILVKEDLPEKLVLYHGTSNFRLERILKDGLVPIDFDNRVWNNTPQDKKNRPEHREDSVYLTSSRPQAEYYANKATNIDRARRTGKNKTIARRSLGYMKQELTRIEWILENPKGENLSNIEELKAEAADLRKKMASYELTTNFYDKFEPVLLQITIPKSQYNKLMADDDYLLLKKDKNPTDWQDSLSYYGQVAFRGIIPPSRIKVIAQGKNASRKSY